jgi:hypothetical protein
MMTPKMMLGTSWMAQTKAALVMWMKARVRMEVILAMRMRAMITTKEKTSMAANLVMEMKRKEEWRRIWQEGLLPLHISPSSNNPLGGNFDGKDEGNSSHIEKPDKYSSANSFIKKSGEEAGTHSASTSPFLVKLSWPFAEAVAALILEANYTHSLPT